MATAPAQPAHWAAEFDRKLNERFALADQQHRIRSWAEPGQTDNYYRESLKKVDAADAELAGLRQHHANLQSQIDAATAEHAKTCRPIQERLASDGVPPAERVALRAQINEANSRLDATLAEVRPLLEASEKELELVRVRAGARHLIEMSAQNAGPPEVQARLKVLRRAADLLEHHLLFGLKRKANESGCPIVEGAHELLRSFAKTIADEQAAIRAQRLKELYAG